MTPEQMEQKIEFIIEQQAQFTVDVQLLKELDAQAGTRMARLEEFLVQLAQSNDSRMQALTQAQLRTENAVSVLTQRTAKLEDSFVLLVELAQSSDARMDAMTQAQIRTENAAGLSAQRITKLEDSFVLLVELAQSSSVRLDAVETRMENIDGRMDALTQAQIRTEGSVSLLSQKMVELAEAQTHTEQRLNALIDIVSEGRNGKSQG